MLDINDVAEQSLWVRYKNDDAFHTALYREHKIFEIDRDVSPTTTSFFVVIPSYNNSDWIERTQAVFRRHPPALYAAGHDHNLQLLDSGDVAGLFVVSGAGARERVSTVTHLPETIFAHAAEGFVAVDFERTDEAERIVLRVVEPLVSVDEPVFETVLD